MTQVWAGNPDRQGEAGAYELLLNPWARSAGLFAMTTASVRGVDALFLNPAGVGRIDGSQIGVAHNRLFSGSGISLNALGYCQKLGSKGGFLGVNINSVDFGQITVTTTDQPEGTGAVYSPNFINVGLTYGYVFDNKISVGATFRGISESTSEVSAFGFAFDAGVQYHSGPFKFGISLKNVGSSMRFGGQGLDYSGSNPNSGRKAYNLTYSQKSAKFEMPSQLLIGGAYDVNIDKKTKLTAIANFTSNAYSRDQIGAGLEFMYDMFTLRGGYKYELGRDPEQAQLHSGLSAGFSVDLPLKTGTDKILGIDYAYLTSQPFGGTHSIALRFSF